MSPPTNRFEALMVEIDAAEAQVKAAIGIFDFAINEARRLPFPFRPLMVAIGKMKRRKGYRQLLRLDTARAQLEGFRARLEQMPARPGPWEG